MLEIPASLQAGQNATLSPALSGIVAAVLFKSGQTVTAGQVLVQLGKRAGRGATGAGRGQIRAGQARFISHAETHGDCRRQPVRARPGRGERGGEHRRRSAWTRPNLAQLQIIAPFAGTLGIRDVDPGDYLTAGQAVVTLSAAGPLRVLFSVPQTEAGGIAPGQIFSLQTPGGGSTPTTVQGEVVALSPEQDKDTDARAVEGRVAPNPNLLPGMFGVVDIATGAPLPAFAVPSAALNDSTLGPFVFLLSPAGGAYTLSTVYVTIYGSAGDTSWISTSGLSAGEKIVALGGFQLTDGASVTPAPP